jgi:integrative and conjugative element protein (TIGR02256 family)
MTSQVWLAKSAEAAIRAESALHHEEETGGMLLGYAHGDSAVVVTIVGPGPGARHAATTFVPDAIWQQDRLAQMYADSGRTVTYLGDWHTHPRGVPILSRRDRKTLHRIAHHGPSRQPRPLSAVLVVGDSEQEIVFWQYRGRWTKPSLLRTVLFQL